MTIERPMLPPAADSVHAFSPQPESGNLTSESRKVAGSLSRRLLLTGLAVLPAAAPAVAAAIPTFAPAMPTKDPRAVASVKRAEEIVELLRTRYIREGWKMDEEAAERTLAYCRKYAEDGSDPDDEREVALDFFHSHGQSLDWVFDGDIDGLICGLAKYSMRANNMADAKLLDLADRYAVAFEKWGDLARLADEMDHGAKAKPLPDVLHWRDKMRRWGFLTSGAARSATARSPGTANISFATCGARSGGLSPRRATMTI